MIRYQLNDVEKVDAIMTHETIYPFVTDDGCPEASDFTSRPLLQNPNIYCLGPNVTSLFIYVPVNSVTYDIHSHVLPESRKQSIELVLASAEYIFKQTKCLKIITWVPEFNKRALNLALKCGCRLEGVSHFSFQKNGKLYHQYLLGMTKEDWLCQ